MWHYKLLSFLIVCLAQFLLRMGCAPWLLRKRLEKPYAHNCDVWIHGASVGEIKAGLQFAELLWWVDSSLRIMLTYQTSSAEHYISSVCHPGLVHRYFPLDSAYHIEKMLPGLRAVVLMESELWPNLVLESKKALIPIYWLGVRVGPGMMRLRKYAPRAWMRLVQAFEGIGLLDYGDAPLFKNAQIFSGSWDPKMLGLEICPVKGSDLCLLSWHDREWIWSLEIIRANPERRLFLQLRYPEEREFFEQNLAQFGIAYSLWPNLLEVGVVLVAELGTTPVLLRYCEEAWMGGGFAKTSHSPREALAAGLLVWVGPHLPAGDFALKRWVDSGVVGVWGSARHQDASVREGFVKEIELQSEYFMDLAHRIGRIAALRSGH